MTTIASGIVLGFLLATLYAAVFHFLLGGRPRRIIIFLIASWIGFIFGHFIGDFFNFETLKLGAVHLLSASVGSWVALLLVWFLAGQENRL